MLTQDTNCSVPRGFYGSLTWNSWPKWDIVSGNMIYQFHANECGFHAYRLAIIPKLIADYSPNHHFAVWLLVSKTSKKPKVTSISYLNLSTWTIEFYLESSVEFELGQELFAEVVYMSPCFLIHDGFS